MHQPLKFFCFSLIKVTFNIAACCRILWYTNGTYIKKATAETLVELSGSEHFPANNGLITMGSSII